MPSDAGSDFTPDRRLHHLSWLFVAIDYLKHLFFPIAAFVFLGARDDYAMYALFGAVPLVASALWQQWIYRYGFGPQGLVIREGFFFRNIRRVDYSRVENVDTKRNLLHRMLDVAEVRVETSSGGSSEAVIRVLSIDAVREMRERIFAAREIVAPVQQDVDEDSELLALSPGELVRYGLIDNRGVIVVAAVVAFFAEFFRQEAFERYVGPLLENLPGEFGALGPVVRIVLVFSAILGLVAGTRILSVLLALVTLHDFRLSKSGDDLRVRHGLLTRISLTLRRPRIQAVHRTETVLHRLFRRVSLRVDLAGGANVQENAQNGQGQATRKLWLAPVCTPAKADELIAIALPMVKLDDLEWHGLSPRARMRLFRLLALLWLLPATPLAFWFLGFPGIAAVLPIVPLLWLHAHLYVKYTGWAMHEHFFMLRRGWLTRRQSIVPRNRIQSASVSESPFDRRYRMAGLGIDTAGASAQRLRIPYLDQAAARELAMALYAPRLR